MGEGTGDVTTAPDPLVERASLARWGWPIAALATAVGLALAWRQLPFLADDALISLRYSRRLADGHGLTWTDGERVEGYSNLTWVLAVAALAVVGVDPVVAARLLGVACLAASVGAIVWWFAPSRDRWLPATAAVLTFVATGWISVWTIGGLEQPLVAALLATAVVRSLRLERSGPTSARDPWITGALLGALALTRPDGVLLAAALVAVLGLRRSADRRVLLALTLPVLVAVAGQMAFRLAYYGDWLPNPAYAKVALAWPRVRAGLRYDAVGLAWAAAAVLPALGGLVVLLRSPSTRTRGLLLGIPAAAWLAYVALIGGDVFPARRHLVPVVVLISLLGGELWDALARRAARPAPAGGRIRPGAVVLAAVGVLVAHALLQQIGDREVQRAGRERWEHDCTAIAGELGRAWSDEQPLLAVSTAGCFPYASGLPALDLLGLTDRHLAHARPDDMGEGTLGHELGDPDYVLRRVPDVVILCGPAGDATGCHRSERYLVADPRFAAQYRLVPLVVGEPPRHTQAWVRVASSAVGVRSTSDEVVVPGLLFGTVGDGDPGLACRVEARCPVAGSTLVGLDGDDRFLLALGSAPVAGPEVALPAGRWRVEAVTDPAGAAGDVDVEVAVDGEPLAAGRGAVEVDLARPGAAVVVLAAADSTPTSVVEVRLRRLDG